MPSMRRLISLVEAVAPRLHDVTQLPAFRAWFGHSKVVDQQGRPLRCYHGTRSHFDVFSDEDAPDRGGILAFFTADTGFASSYASDDRHAEVQNGALVMPVYLRIEQPFDFRTDWRQAAWFYDETGGITDKWEMNRILMGLGHPIDNIDDTSTPDLTEEQFVQAVKAGSWDALEAPEFVEWLRGGGECDGIVLLENGAINYAIFEPNQVKSALTNSGNYDPDEDSIVEARGQRRPRGLR